MAARAWRDTRVRWALEEVGRRYEVRLVSFSAKKQPAHLRVHPFGLIPTYEEGDLVLFETGAIVLHIAEHHAGLFPGDANARARAITWIRGLTRPVTASGRYAPPRPSSFGEIAGLQLHTSFDRREFGFEWQMELPGGGDAVSWDVELDIDLLLKREDADAEG